MIDTMPAGYFRIDWKPSAGGGFDVQMAWLITTGPDATGAVVAKLGDPNHADFVGVDTGDSSIKMLMDGLRVAIKAAGRHP